MSAGSNVMRVARYIARSGVCSRRSAEELIVSGRVSVNGVLVSSPAVNVSCSDAVCIDGKRISGPVETKVILTYKLDGELVTTKDAKNRATVFDRLRKIGAPHLAPVGQMDYHTEGLLILSNDGEYTRYLEHPSNQIPRRYRVRVHGLIDDKIIQSIERGTVVDGYKYKNVRARIDHQSNTISWLTMQIYEGKYHEIKKILNYYDLDVLRLIRTDYGSYSLGNMKPGDIKQVKTIPLSEVHRIRSW